MSRNSEQKSAAAKRRWEADCGRCGSDYIHTGHNPPSGCAHCGSLLIRYEEVDWDDE